MSLDNSGITDAHLDHRSLDHYRVGSLSGLLLSGLLLSGLLLSGLLRRGDSGGVGSEHIVSLVDVKNLTFTLHGSEEVEDSLLYDGPLTRIDVSELLNPLGVLIDHSLLNFNTA